MIGYGQLFLDLLEDACEGFGRMHQNLNLKKKSKLLLTKDAELKLPSCLHNVRLVSF